MKEFYFSKFEDRKPYKPIPENQFRTLLFQFSGIVTIALGLSYIYWRWRYSLNMEALWFAVPLVIAETLSFVSTILIVFNFWSYKDARKAPPVRYLSEIEDLQERDDRPVSIDVFIATYNEDVELVRLSISDAKKMIYPFRDVNIKIYVLDDGRRDGRDPNQQNMKMVAEEEGVGYLTRENNDGYKAGNLKNGLNHTNGDLFIILDADTRPLPEFLVNTSGYFRNKKLAWVQTPQWFYDTTEPQKLSAVIKWTLGLTNKYLTKPVDALFGKFEINEDIFGNDPRMFYDVILRKRNFYNAAFCCGAGSIHRRESVMSLALKDFANGIKKSEKSLLEAGAVGNDIRKMKKKFLLKQEITPFKFHASEDIYTSIMLHADEENKWESLQHPEVECKMLSTQDLDSWIKQHQRYAQGSLDIAFKDNPIFKKGLSIGQKICYFNTIWSYFAPLWIIVFLLSPIIFFFTLQLPVKVYSFDFFKYFVPFQLMNTITITLGTWGIWTKRGDQYYISGFWYMLMSIISVISGKKVKFNVTPKHISNAKNRQHIIPHLVIISLCIIGMSYNLVLLILGYHPTPSGFAANGFWTIINLIDLGVIIRAANWKTKEAG
jgi:cellulose synthase (UDP-forming)